MFKKHLHNVYRKYNEEDKSLYDFCLTQNERNLEIDKEVFNSFVESITQEDIRFYPNLNTIKSKLAQNLKLTPDNILLTPGSDIAIKTLFEAIDFGEGHFLTTDYHFPMYSVYGNLYNVPIKVVEYNYDLTYNTSDILSSISEDTKLVILSNPNSPLGDYKNFSEIKPILDTGVPVLLDEAYIELTAKESLIEHINTYPNLFVSRTFSKGLGAAGSRVGYIVSNLRNINILSKFRFMYEIPTLSAKYVELILDQKNYFAKYCQSTLKGKGELVKILSNKNEVEVIDTDSSWVFIKATPRVLSLFSKYNVGVRTISLPKRSQQFIKFNYDPALEDSDFLKALLNENLN